VRARGRFDKFVECEPTSVDASPKKLRRKRALFWQIETRSTEADRDALKFRDGLILPLKRLRLGQHAKVVASPVISGAKSSEPEAQIWETLPQHVVRVQCGKN
jgi:hypothetical protein